MSFLLQCLFYFVRAFLGLLSNEYVISSDTDGFRYALVCISIVMTAIGFLVIFKKKISVLKYLDIPLIFVWFALSTLIDMFVLPTSFLSMVPTIFGIVPSTIRLIREIRWVIDVVKKRRRPQKKNVVVLVAYVLASAVVITLSFTGLNFFEPKPTQEEINLVNTCYEYTEKYLSDLPDDAEKLEQIAALTTSVTEGDVFKTAFDESLYYENSDGVSVRWMEFVKDYNRKVAYSEVVMLHLKTFIATGNYEAYKQFFTENAGYIRYNQTSYSELWEKDKEYITDESFEIIIDSYKNILSLCDNDGDRYLILTDIIDFYETFKPDSKEIENYEEKRWDLMGTDSFYKRLLADETSYTSEKLRVD